MYKSKSSNFCISYSFQNTFCVKIILLIQFFQLLFVRRPNKLFNFEIWYKMSKNKKSINLTYVHHVSEFLIFLKKHKNYAFYVFVQLNDERNTFFMRLSQKSGVKVRFANFATRFSICASLGIYTLCIHDNFCKHMWQLYQ